MCLRITELEDETQSLSLSPSEMRLLKDNLSGARSSLELELSAKKLELKLCEESTHSVAHLGWEGGID